MIRVGARTPLDIAESEKIVARMRYLNARTHADLVAARLGIFGPEYAITQGVIAAEQRHFVAAIDRVLDLCGAASGATVHTVHGGETSESRGFKADSKVSGRPSTTGVEVGGMAHPTKRSES